jgi:hypothetical protein
MVTLALFFHENPLYEPYWIFLSLSGKYSPQINATHNVSATHPLIPTSHLLLVVGTWVRISLYFTNSNR